MELSVVEERVIAIRDMAQTVYGELECGYGELIYKEALMVELRAANLPYERERCVPIKYKEYVIGLGKADIVALPAPELVIPIECKIGGITDDHRQQLLTYMKGIGSNCLHGILISFPKSNGQVDGLQFYWVRREASGAVDWRLDRGGTWSRDGEEIQEAFANNKRGQRKTRGTTA